MIRTKLTPRCVALAFAALCCSFSYSELFAAVQSQGANIDKANSQIIVRYKASSVYNSAQGSNAARSKLSNGQANFLRPVPVPGLRQVKSFKLKPRRAPLALSRNANLAQANEIVVLKMLDKNANRQRLIERLRASGEVEYAEADSEMTASSIPNDPSFSTLWGLNNTGQSGGVADVDIDAPEAWSSFTTGDSSVVVAVVDTGVHYSHPDLLNNMWVNPGETGLDANNLDKATNGIDDDLNGYIDDVHGIDCINDDSDPLDDDSSAHGTHIAGTIGAQGDNNTQVVGVNWDVSLMALKYLGANGRGVTSDAIECLSYMSTMKADHGINIKVSNNSYGGSDFSQAMYDAILAMQDQGILFVAAAGNDGEDNDQVPHYPSSYDLPSIISVASINRSGGVAGSSNYGQESVDVAAPGVSIFSTSGASGTAFLSGTSMATPHVAGVAALIAAQDASLDWAQIKGRILDTAVSTPSLQGITVTGGLINAYEALDCINGGGATNLYLSENSPPDFVKLGEPVTLELLVSACGEGVVGELVSLTFDNAEANIDLLDNGVAPDSIAGDGRYTASWSPTLTGPVNLTVAAAGQSILLSRTVVDVPSYDIDPAHPFNWVESSDGIDVGLGNVDDEGAEVAIGFDFEFYGVQYHSVHAHSNGMLKFNGNVELSFFEFLDLPSPSAPNNFIAPFWEDLNPSVSEGKIFYKLEGTAPNRRLIVQWHELLHFNQESEPLDSSVTFQAILYEGSNDIVLQYLDLSFGSPIYDDAARALIGIESFDGEDGISYLNQGQPASTELLEGQAIRFSLSDSSDRTLSISKPVSGAISGSLNQIDCGEQSDNCFGQYPQNTQVTLTASPEPGYHFVAWSGAACQAQLSNTCVVNLTNHTVVGAQFALSPAVVIDPVSDIEVSESGTFVSFSVNLSVTPTDNVSVSFSSSDETEAVLSQNTLVFTPENALDQQMLRVTGVDDQIDDGNINFQILSAPAVSDDGDYTGFDAIDLSGTNLDDDSSGASIMGNNLVIDEAGGSSQFSVQLTSIPSADVTINLSSSDTSEGLTSSSQLVFTPENALQAQTVMVSGVDDNLLDGNITFAIVFSPMLSDDPLYADIQLSSIAVQNTDLDQDSDVDGKVDAIDNCPSDFNPSQLNTDMANDGGDACDADDDNDLVPDAQDNCSIDVNPLQTDTDSDEQGDVCDADSDNDSVFNLDDVDPLDPTRCEDVDSDECDDCSIGTDGFGPQADANPQMDGADLDGDFICDLSDSDLDGDQVDNDSDNCPTVFNPDQLDSNLDDVGDVCVDPVDASKDELCTVVMSQNARVILICL